MKPLRAWALTLNGEVIRDADGVIPVYTTEKVAKGAVGTGGLPGDGEEPLQVEIREVEKKGRKK